MKLLHHFYSTIGVRPFASREIKASKCDGEDPDKFRQCLTRRAMRDNGRKTGKLCHEYDDQLIADCREESKK